MAKTPPKINLPEGIDQKELLAKLVHEKTVAHKYQKRRHEHWNEIYQLYRDIVQINRLTQRQSNNIPLMKETIRTIGAKINEPLDARLEDQGADLDKEIKVNELWRQAAHNDRLDLLDRVDKKQELLYGRTHMSLNVDLTKEIPVTIGVEDVYELLVDPKTAPYDIETARYVVKTNIFRPLDEILSSKRYDKEAKGKLKQAYAKKKGSGGKGSVYEAQKKKKDERLQVLGVTNVQELEGYDTIVALDGHVTHIWDKKLKEYVRYYVLVADESIILQADTLVNTIGVDFYPWEGWAEDLEITDYWSDGVGDLIRIPNKTINTWISQHMENRTLRSFGMNFYNSKIKGFKPQKFQPKPFGWYPLPGKPQDVYQRVDIPELQGTLQDIQFITQIAERASATGAVEKGAVEDVKRTLGEIEIAVGNALQRTNDMAPLYNAARRRLIEKWYKMMEANVPDGAEITLYKRAPNGTLVGKKIKKEEWVSDVGYKVDVGSNSQRTIEKTDEIVRLKAVQQEFPNNPVLRKVSQKKLIQLVDLSPQDIDEIMEWEEQAAQGGPIVPEEVAAVAGQAEAAAADPAGINQLPGGPTGP